MGLARRPLLEDLREFQLAKDPTNPHFGTPPKLKDTWRRLILLELALRAHPDPHSGLHEHQRTELGRREGGNALLELLPLPKPSRSAADWLYGDWTGCHS